jgi:hypothetical protein
LEDIFYYEERWLFKYIHCCSSAVQKNNIEIAVMEDPSKFYNYFVGFRLSFPAYALKCCGRVEICGWSDRES